MQVILVGDLARQPARIPEPEYLDKAMVEIIFEYNVTDTDNTPVQP